MRTTPPRGPHRPRLHPIRLEPARTGFLRRLCERLFGKQRGLTGCCFYYTGFILSSRCRKDQRSLATDYFKWHGLSSVQSLSTRSPPLGDRKRHQQQERVLEDIRQEQSRSVTISLRDTHKIKFCTGRYTLWRFLGNQDGTTTGGRRGADLQKIDQFSQQCKGSLHNEWNSRRTSRREYLHR